jgi:hypothetical protein
MFQSKEYIEYPLEGIAYTPNFLGLCTTLIQMLTKTNHDLKYCLSKQFQIPYTTLILFLLSKILVVVGSVGKTTREVGVTR